MAASFVPCPACARHVREGDGVCPFCGAKAVSAPRPMAAPRGFVSRAVLLAGAAAGASIALTECSSSTVSPAYGGIFVPADASAADGRSSDDATADSPSVVALYGAMMVPDASTDGPTVQPLYGAVAIPDASEGTDGRASGDG